MTKGWYGNRYGHSLASRGIKSRGILEDISLEVSNFETTKRPENKYSEFRHYTEFLPEIQAEIDNNKSLLINMDLFDISSPSQYKLRELIERGERDGLIYKIVYMKPQNYIDAIEHGFGDNYRGDIDFRLDEEKLKALLNKFKNGKRVCVPSLTYEIFDGHVGYHSTFSQEGHHRSQIAKMIGKEKIPVIVAFPKDLEMKNISSKKMTPYIEGEINI